MSTFNFLNEEKRYVAGAFIPPSKVQVLGDEFLTDTERSPENDMMIVMERMAKLQDKQLPPDDTDSKHEH